MTTPYQPYLEWLNHQSAHMMELVHKWASVNTHAYNLTGLAHQMNELKERFSLLDGKMQELNVPSFTTIEDDGSKIARPLGKVLHITKRQDAPIRLFLGGHMDTVFLPTAPFQTTSFANGKITGPGVADMKGGLVIMLYALEALEKSPYAEHIGWEILINPDEEIGSCGSKAILERCAQRNMLGLLFEPSFPDGAVVSTRGASMNVVLIIRGKAAHAGRDFHHGKSAAFGLAPLVMELEKLNNIEDGITINVGQITSGHGFNTVPDVGVIKINARATTSEHVHKTKEAIYKLIQTHQEKTELQIELHEHTLREAKAHTDELQKLLEQFKSCADDLKIPLQWRATRGVSDGNTLARSGLVCLDSLGAVGGGLHTYNEYILAESLLERSKLSALFLMKLGNGEFTYSKKTPINL